MRLSSLSHPTTSTRHLLVQSPFCRHQSRRHSKRSIITHAASNNKSTNKTSTSNDPDAQQAEKAKLAIAAKISAARTLARKLAEEKQATAAAAQLASQKTLDPETAQTIIRSVEKEVAELAREAAIADAAARVAVRDPSVGELARLKEENKALQQLVIQLAADREHAEKKLQELREKGAASLVTTTDAIDDDDSSNTTTSTTTNTTKTKGKSSSSSSTSSLTALIDECIAQNQRIGTLPQQPVPVGSTITVLYNVFAGPLPHNDGTAPVLKIGWNRWESQSKIEMKKVDSSSDNSNGWWMAEVVLPSLLFRFDFVVEDKNSGAVDNNGGQDFRIELANAPTAEQVTAARLELLEKAETEAQALFAQEEEKIYAQWMSAAEGAAREARLTYVSARRESILLEARAVVEERRGPGSIAGAVADTIPGVFAWATIPEAGSSAVLLYNKASGQLASAGSVVVHIGYDGWWMQDKKVLPMRPLTAAELTRYKKQLSSTSSSKDTTTTTSTTSDDTTTAASSEWWCAEVPVWNTAAALDFAFTNDARSAWDNNNGSDFHTLVRGAASGEKLVQLVYQALELAGTEEASRGELLAERRVLQRADMKATAARRRRDLQRKFLYTDPLTPRAGLPVKIFYNPDKTVLRGRPDVYLQAGFNRWMHEERVAPIKMTPAIPDAGGLGFLVAEIDLPADAFAIDMVFRDNAGDQGGFVDDNKSLDYHIPVVSGTASAPSLRIAHVASEMAPIAKAGGLGDVVTALGRAVQEEGHDIEIVLPKYDCIDYSSVKNLALVKEFNHNNVQVKVWRGTVEGLTTTFLEPCNGMFWIGRIYTDMNGDRHRFGTFCVHALEYLLHHSPRKPDVLHCHDWQSAPIAGMDRQGIACVFTIHNLNYGADLIGMAMANSNAATTVSPTYATEISGHPAIAPHHHKFYGIRNGIDVDIWDPSADPFLPVGYSADDAAVGKAAAKEELRRRMGLAEGDVPIVGCVTRLTHQKGIHMIKHAAWRVLERGAQFVLLGSAPDPKVQGEFDQLAEDLKRQYPDRARLWFAYDEPLSHLIYAGCDMFLVPSIFEPCGLTQMIAMRYGTVPVVRRTGGLADTVFDVDDDEDKAVAMGMAVNGYSFDGADSDGVDYALNRAMSAWYSDKEGWSELTKRVMTMDWSWSSPAQDYIELYHRALKK